MNTYVINKLKQEQGVKDLLLTPCFVIIKSEASKALIRLTGGDFVKRVIALVFAVLLIVCCFASCGKENTGKSDASTGFLSDEQFSTSVEDTVSTDRKLVKTAELGIETKKYDDFIKLINNKTAEVGGYIESSNTSGSSENLYGRNATITVRVPAEKLDDFVSLVGDAATIVYNNTRVEDITSEYIDVESRIAALEAEQEALIEMLKAANDVSQLLDIQARLSEVNGNLESYKAQLKVFSEQVKMSTVTMNIDEVDRESSAEQQGFWGEVGSRFSDNVYAIGQGLRAIAIWFISSLPYFAIIAVVAVVVIVVIRVSIKSSKKKK